MYRYSVMALSTTVVFVVIYVLLDLLFGTAISWGSVLFEGVVFGLLMTGIQYYKERKNNNIE
ncbi:MAG: hypothetical protein J6M25_03865 [Prevotella sp.]|nr:hypothetical protein [Prevotella sp.]